MTNSIKARIKFSFQGKTYSPETIINLDEVISAGQDLDRLHSKLAQANGIDTYSYLYEVMESSEVIFSEATGSAANFLSESGRFDFEAFRTANERSTPPPMLELARQYMKIERLEDIEGLEAALLAAYKAGQQHSQ